MENKNSQYFKYALGEIILVVIGILIALGINNWNEHRKLNINNKILVKKLQKENSLNLEWLQESEAYRNEIPDILEDFHDFLEKAKLETNEDSLNTLLFSSLRATAYTFSYVNLSSYISQQNQETNSFNQELLELLSYEKDLEIFTQKAADFKIDEVYKMLENDVNLMTGEIISFETLKSVKFRNKLFMIMNFEDEINQMYSNTLRQIKKVDSLISNRLIQ